MPVVLGDAGAAWTAEGNEIAATDAQFDEIVVVPSKVAGLSIVSRELAMDSSPSAQQLVGEGLAQSLANKIDAAFFADTTANGPSGLLSVTDAQVVDTSAGITNTDPFAEALSLAETVGAAITSFFAHPNTVLTLSKVKKQTGSNEPLLGYDASQPTFDGPTQAIRCAEALCADAETLGIEIRAGIHTGECELLDDDIGGIAVHIAARILGQAGAGEILVSRTVRDLVVGSGTGFEDRGSVELRGVPGTWQLLAVDRHGARAGSAEAELASMPTPGPRAAMRRSDRAMAVMARRIPWILRGMARLAPASRS